MAAKGRYRTVKGVRDLLPDEAAAFAAVERTARRVFSLYGYREVRTPLVEDTDLFVRGVGEGSEIVGKQMYTFPDKKGRSLTLRPESTAAVARAYLQHDMATWPQPVKLFYAGPHFRYERPQKGRYRQFHQIGAELLGDPGPYGDVELLVMLLRFLSELGFEDLVVGLNSVGDPECRQRYSKRLREHLEPHRDGLGADSRRRLEANPLRILDTKAPAERKLLEGAPRLLDVLGEPARRHFDVVRERLERFGVACRIDDRLVRGLDYYTRTVFEIASASLGAQNAILGGGRYDGLIGELGGPSVPGIGFAIGQDRLVDVLPEASPARVAAAPPVSVLVLGEPLLRQGLEIAEELRAAGLAAICDLEAGSLKAGLRKANRRGCRWIVLFGEDEAAAGNVVLKDFESGAQETVPRDGFAAEVAARVSA